MSPRDLGPFNEWVESEDPPVSLALDIKAWIDALDAAPWQAPSKPIDEMSVPGEYQTREAIVLGVDVIYQEDYRTGLVAWLDVRSHPRPSEG